MRNYKQLSLLSLLLAGVSIQAQENVGSLLGTIRDPQGKRLGGVALTVAGATGTRNLMSNETGDYRLPFVLPGTFTVRVSKEGYVGASARLMISAGQPLRQDFVLRPIQEAGATVEVTAVAPQLDKTEVKSASYFNSSEMAALPTGGNLNAWGALNLSPGVTGNTTAARIRGGLQGQAQYTVNGIVVRDPAMSSNGGRQTEYVLDDLTEDIQVIQSPLNAKYGNTSSGVVNVVTKTGGNTFTGSLRVKLGRNPWGSYVGSVANRFNAALTGSVNGAPELTPPPQVFSDDLRRTYEVSVLGPIIKDRLTFSIGTRFVQRSRDSFNMHNVFTTAEASGWNSYIPGFVGPDNRRELAAYSWGADPASPTALRTISGETSYSYFITKLFYQINNSHAIEFDFSRDAEDQFAPRTTGSSRLVDEKINMYQDSIRDMRAINYRGVLSNNLQLDVKWGRRQSIFRFPSGPSDPVFVRLWSSTASTLFTTATSSSPQSVLTGGAVYSGSEDRDVETFSANLEAFLGDHKLDLGLEQLNERLFWVDDSGPNRRLFYLPGRLNDGNWLVYNYVGSAAAADTPLGRSMRAGTGFIPEYLTREDSGGGDPKSLAQVTSLFANDLWKLNESWSINLGVRLEAWRNRDRTGWRISSEALSPRFLTQWDMDADGRHLLSLSIASFRGTLNQAMLGTGYFRIPGNVTRRYFWNQGSTTPYGVSTSEVFNPANYGSYYLYRNSDVLRDMQKNLRPEKNRELEFRYRRAFATGGWSRVSLIYRRTTDLLRSVGKDVRIDMIDPTGAAATGPNGHPRYLEQDPSGIREYRSMELEWSYPLLKGASNKLTWGGNWTLSRSLANSNWSDEGATQYFDQISALNIPYALYNPYGEVNSSRRNVAKTWLQWSIGTPKGIRNEVSLLANYNSGAPEGPTQSYFYPNGAFTSGAADLPSSFSLYINGRGRRWGQDFYGLDLQWNVNIPINVSTYKDRMNFFIELTISNIFNSQIPTAFVSGVRNTNTRNWTGMDGLGGIIPNQTAMHQWGTVNGMTAYRSVARFDMGIRF